MLFLMSPKDGKTTMRVLLSLLSSDGMVVKKNYGNLRMKHNLSKITAMTL